MKTLVAIILSVGILFSAVAIAEEYPLVGVITCVDRDNDIVYFTDGADNIWSFSSVEDWFVGDIVACIMDNLGTVYTYDDVIVKLLYGGYIDYFVSIYNSAALRPR